MKFLPDLQANRLACTGSWILAEDTRPLSQKQRIAYYS